MNRPAPIGGPRVRVTRIGRVERWFREPAEVLETLRAIGALEDAQAEAEAHGVALLAALGPSRGSVAGVCRQYVIAEVMRAHELSIRRAACLFGLDRSSIRQALRSVAKRRGLAA